MEGEQMKPAIILFVIALGATGTWLYSLGKGRTTALGHQADITDVLIYVLITGSMSFLGDIVIRAYAPVQHLRARARLLKRRIKHERQNVTRNQQQIISVEKQGFWHDQMIDQNLAAHRISRDHAIAERSPSAT
jgi:mannitol-specific phosphotransferase system IIBC component